MDLLWCRLPGSCDERFVAAEIPPVAAFFQGAKCEMRFGLSERGIIQIGHRAVAQFGIILYED